MVRIQLTGVPSIELTGDLLGALMLPFPCSDSDVYEYIQANQISGLCFELDRNSAHLQGFFPNPFRHARLDIP